MSRREKRQVIRTPFLPTPKEARERVREIIKAPKERVRERIERLSPPLQAVLLDEVVLALQDLRKDVQASIPVGESPCFRRGITNECIDIKEGYPIPWFSFALYNYGPNSVFMGVNKKPELDAIHGDEIQNGETREVDMHAAKIREIFLQCLPGEDAIIRIRAVY